MLELRGPLESVLWVVDPFSEGLTVPEATGVDVQIP